MCPRTGLARAARRALDVTGATPEARLARQGAACRLGPAPLKQALSLAEGARRDVPDTPLAFRRHLWQGVRPEVTFLPGLPELHYYGGHKLQALMSEEVMGLVLEHAMRALTCVMNNLVNHCGKSNKRWKEIK